MTDPDWITTAEAGRMLGVTAESARKWAQAGEFDPPGRASTLTIIQVGPTGSRYLIDRVRVEAYLRRKAAA